VDDPPPRDGGGIAVPSPIWPAQLDHLRLDSDDTGALAGFYADTLGMAQSPLPGGDILLRGPHRRLIIGAGKPGGRPYHAYRVQSPAQLDDIRSFIAGRGLDQVPQPSPLFAEDAVAVRDPDGWVNVFGLEGDEKPLPPGAPQSPPARLQHVVVETKALGPMMDYYENGLGFVPSDYVLKDGGAKNVAFYRSDPEHHSFAVFEASSVCADHHAYETSGWMDIRDWADRLAERDVPIWWGPGRHGPGNNLFFMVKDPHGDSLEFSAEIEVMDRDTPPRTWPHSEKTLNLWGPGWIRD
jgi:hypothetical protein